MFQIRIHGRGGQGVVTAAELLSVAAFSGGRHAQAFPSFGSERMGAPVVAFCRIDDRDIRSREPIAEPDAVIVQDPTLLHMADVFDGLRPDGYLLINTARGFDELGIRELTARMPSGHARALPATEIAMQHIGRPIPNAVLLGAFAAMTGLISLASVTEAIEQRFSGAVAEKNIAAATSAHKAVLAPQEAFHAQAG